MIASHRAPATWLMTLGGVVFVFSILLPSILAPAPEGVWIASLILRCAAPLILAAGGCIYARGIGQPVWLGLFGATFIGLLMLLWLPDLRPDPGDGDDL